jgi:carboxyl-terminal processing protease
MGNRATRGEVILGFLTVTLLGALLAIALVFFPVLRNFIFKPPAPREASGIWQSRGYGWTLSMANGNVEFHERNGPFCLARVRDTNSLADNIAHAVTSPDGSILTVPSDAPGYNYIFERIDRLPEPCQRPKSSFTPSEIIDYVDAIFTQHYPFFSLRGTDWPRIVAAARAKVTATTADEQLFDIISEMLRALRDGHVTLAAVYDGRRRRFRSDADVVAPPLPPPVNESEITPRARLIAEAAIGVGAAWTAGIGELLLNDSAVSVQEGRILYGMIGDVGLLTVRSMEGYDGIEDIDAAMESAITALASAKAIILDISMNDGGQDVISARIVGRFATRVTAGYYKKPGDHAGSELQQIDVVPSIGRRYTGPVFILTSRVTGSAAEIFTLAMRALPNVTHVGGRTRGILSDMLIKSLPNGWTVSLSSEVYLDHRKRSFEWTGIPPDVPLEVRREAKSRDADIAAARALVDLIATVHR